MATHWTCQRKKEKKRCGHRNPGRKRKCERCGGAKPPRRAPSHMSALELTYADYIELNGGEKCGICGNGPGKRRLDRDHDHHTGAPRGLLCSRCNRALPAWVTLEWLADAIRYLMAAKRRG